MLCDTMRPETGSASRTSCSSHTSPFSSTANCSSPSASNTKRQRRRDEPTSPPSLQQPPQHLLSIPTLSLPSLIATNVATPTPLAGAQPRDNHAMLAVVTTIIPPYADARRLRHCPTTLESQEDLADCPGTTSEGATRTTGTDPASLLTDDHAAALQAVAHSTVPPTQPLLQHIPLLAQPIFPLAYPLPIPSGQYRSHSSDKWQPQDLHLPKGRLPADWESLWWTSLLLQPPDATN